MPQFYIPGPTSSAFVLWFYANQQYVYAAVIIVFGFSFWLSIRRTLAVLEKQRLSRIEAMKRSNSSRMPSSMGVSFQQTKTILQNQILSQFSIIRKSLTLLLLLIVVLSLVFPYLGQLPATVVSLLVASTTVVVGIAAKPFVENLISGMVMSFSRHFLVGDTVAVDGHYGTIEDISLTHTTIKLWDWRRFIMPNSSMLSKEVLNYSYRGTYLWAFIEFWVAYDVDLGLLEQKVLQIAEDNKHKVSNEIPEFWVMEMNKEGVICRLGAWVSTPPDAWEWKVTVRKDLYKYMQEQGLKSHLIRHASDQPMAPASRPPIKGLTNL